MDAFGPIADHILKHTVKFKLCPDLWGRESMASLGINDSDIKQVKYWFVKDDEFLINPAIDDIPCDKGGLYFFYVKPHILESHNSYLLYIGRAQKTRNQNLRKRVKEYLADNRSCIGTMINFWPNHLFLKWLELDDNDTIVDMEKRLINSLLPPFNSEIPDYTIKRAIAAFPS